MKKLRTVCGIQIAGLLLAGFLACNQGQLRAGEPTGITPVLPGILLNEDDNGMACEAWVGDYLLISLPENWYGPYGWEIVDISGSAVREIGQTQHMPGPSEWTWSQGNGQSETAYFRLKAVETGQSTVELVCWPPPGMGVLTIHYVVTINITQ